MNGLRATLRKEKIELGLSGVPEPADIEFVALVRREVEAAARDARALLREGRVEPVAPSVPPPMRAPRSTPLWLQRRRERLGTVA